MVHNSRSKFVARGRRIFPHAVTHEKNKKNVDGTSELSELIGMLYDSFLLRDLFAKIVPGTIVLIAALYGPDMGNAIPSQIAAIGWLPALILAGVAWTVGIAVQGFGTLFKFIKLHLSEGEEKAGKRYKDRSDFNANANPFDIKQVERYAIIVEAAGNSATAIFIGIAIAAVRGIPNIFFSSQPVFILVAHFCLIACLPLLIAISLIVVNREHVKKQYEYMSITLNGPTR